MSSSIQENEVDNKELNEKGSKTFALIRQYWTKANKSENIDKNHKKSLEKFFKKNGEKDFRMASVSSITPNDSPLSTTMKSSNDIPGKEIPSLKKKNKKRKKPSSAGQKQNDPIECNDQLVNVPYSGSDIESSQNDLTANDNSLAKNSYVSSEESPELQKKKKKKKKKKKIITQPGDISTLNQSTSPNETNNDSQIKLKKKKKKKIITQPEDNNTLNQSTSANETNNDSQIKLKKKKNKKTLQSSNLDNTNISEENSEIQNKKRTFSDSLSESDEVPLPKKLKRKNVRNLTGTTDEGTLSKIKNKLVKKKDKKLKDVIPGLDTQPELVKFSTKTQSGDFTNEGNELGSFPRTPNEQKYDSDEKNNRTLFVGNLPLNTNQKRLIEIFKPFGKVENVRIRGAVPSETSVLKKVANFKQDYHSDMKSLKGFIVFSNQEEAENALTLNGQVFNGHHLRVDKARAKRPDASKSGSFCDNKSSLFLGNLPYDIDDETLWNTFSRCGTVKNIRVVRDSNTGIGKGFGFVEFEDKSSMDLALELNDSDVGGRQMRVKLTENRNSRTPSKFSDYKNDNRPQKRYFNNFNRKNEDGSPPKKTFKKMNKKRKVEKEKKKIAEIFKS